MTFQEAHLAETIVAIDDRLKVLEAERADLLARKAKAEQEINILREKK